MTTETVEIFGIEYLRVPYIQRGWCTGCVNAGNPLGNRFCAEVERVHTHGCLGTVFIENTPKAFEEYTTKKVLARLEGEE